MKKKCFNEPEMEVFRFDMKDIYTAESTCDTFDAKSGYSDGEETTSEEPE